MSPPFWEVPSPTFHPPVCLIGVKGVLFRLPAVLLSRSVIFSGIRSTSADCKAACKNNTLFQDWLWHKTVIYTGNQCFISLFYLLWDTEFWKNFVAKVTKNPNTCRGSWRPPFSGTYCTEKSGYPIIKKHLIVPNKMTLYNTNDQW